MKIDESELKQIVKRALDVEPVTVPEFKKVLSKARDTYNNSPTNVLRFDVWAACYQSGFVVAGLLLFTFLHTADPVIVSKSHWTSELPSDQMFDSTFVLEFEEADWTASVQQETIL